MIALLQKKSLRLFHPLLKRLVMLYLKKPRTYRFRNIKISVCPTVFHPGLFFSTKYLISFIEQIKIEQLRLLELGAGSGLLYIYCSKRGAKVTATDINETAIGCLRDNALKNDCKIEVIPSDLFEKVSPKDFDLIIINPPYYPRKPKNVQEAAWYCGEDFNYFRRLFEQLNQSASPDVLIYMVLSEDCDLAQITKIATDSNYILEMVNERQIHGEQNYIFLIKPSIDF